MALNEAESLDKDVSGFGAASNDSETDTVSQFRIIDVSRELQIYVFL